MRAQGPSDHHIVLCPPGPFLVWWDGVSRQKRQRLAPPQILIKGWSLPAKTEGATLGHVLSWIKRLSRRDLDILESLCNARIAPFVREMGTARVPDRPADPVIAIIEIGKAVFIEKSFERGKREADVVVRPECSGLGVAGGMRSRRAIRWALAYQPLPFLKDAVLTIAEKSFVIDSRKTPEAVLAPFCPKLTVGDVLTALFDEIAFSGSPAERDADRRELDRRSEEAQSGKARTHSWAQVKASLKEKLKKAALSEPAREKRRQARERRLWRERHPGEPIHRSPTPRIPPPDPWDFSSKPIA